MQQQNIQLQAMLLRQQGSHQRADDAMLELSELQQSSRRKNVKWKFERESMVFVATAPAGDESQARHAPIDGAVAGSGSFACGQVAAQAGASSAAQPASCTSTHRVDAATAPATQANPGAEQQGVQSAPQGTDDDPASEMAGCCIVVLKVRIKFT